MNEPELLDGLLQDIDKLVYGDEGTRDAIMRRAEMVIRNICGSDSGYLANLANIEFYPSVGPVGPEYKFRRWEEGRQKTGNLLRTIKDEISLFKKPSSSSSNTEPMSNDGRVFVVHGRDEGMKQAVARILEKLGLEPIIFHEQPSSGKTIIEKFTEYAEVGFAVVLLSSDDECRACHESSGESRFRARQNVILELGYFLGKLGRERVLTLYRQSERFEMPSDYSGVLYVTFDDADAWQMDLVNELKQQGYDIDANRLLP